jgi:hypothetical protein
MPIVLMIGTVKHLKNWMPRKTKRKTMMNESIMEELIQTLSDVFGDYMEIGEDPAMVASVMFAVAIKQLRINLDDTEFYAILDEIRNTEMLSDGLQEIKNKRTIH